MEAIARVEADAITIKVVLKVSVFIVSPLRNERAASARGYMVNDELSDHVGRFRRSQNAPNGSAGNRRQGVAQGAHLGAAATAASLRR